MHRNANNRPGLDRNDFVADILVLFDVDGAVDHLVPDGRVVGPVNHVNLHFNRSGQRRESAILSHCFQLISLTLWQVRTTRNDATPREFRWGFSMDLGRGFLVFFVWID